MAIDFLFYSLWCARVFHFLYVRLLRPTKCRFSLLEREDATISDLFGIKALDYVLSV
jgi:hypothetical protein